MNFEEIKATFQDDFNKILSYTQNFPLLQMNTDNLLKQWFDSKEKFINQIGGLIYETPDKVSFELSEKDKAKKINAFIERIYSVFLNEELANFINFESSGFFSNTVVKDYTAPDGTIIPEGMKLVKAFKYFISGEKALNVIQSEASQIIQENKIEGILCFSVHPLDFLSLSENNCNWRSCHALDGEYRSGNLSYMCDSSTVICYLKSINDKNNSKIPAFPDDVLWNSKKWRVLLFQNESDNCLFAGRQYPFTCNSALDIIKTYINKTFPNTDKPWSKWHDDKLTSHHYKNSQNLSLVTFFNSVVFINEKFYILEDLIVDNSKLHFNDLINSSYYTPYYSWKYPENFLEDEIIKPLKIGSSPICPICGKKIITTNNIMCCEDCDERFKNTESNSYCDICSAVIHQHDPICYVVEQESQELLILCESCANKETQVCEHCGQLRLSSQIIYNEKTEQFLCEYCHRAVERE